MNNTANTTATKKPYELKANTKEIYIDIESCCTTANEKKALEMYYQYFQDNDKYTELEINLDELIDNILKEKYGDYITNELNNDISQISGLNEIVGFIKGYIYAVQHLKTALLI